MYAVTATVETEGKGGYSGVRQIPTFYLDESVQGILTEDQAKNVAWLEHADYPHNPGYLHDCGACEAKCHCTAGNMECVFEGDHNGTGEAWGE